MNMMNAAASVTVNAMIWNISGPPKQKLKNKFETTFELQISDYQRLAESLAYHEMLGDARGLFDEVPTYQAIDSQRLRTVAQRIFDRSNACVIHYLCAQDS